MSPVCRGPSWPCVGLPSLPAALLPELKKQDGNKQEGRQVPEGGKAQGLASPSYPPPLEQNGSCWNSQSSRGNQIASYQMLSLWPIKIEGGEQKIRSVSEAREKLEPLCTAGGNIKCCSAVENSIAQN